MGRKNCSGCTRWRVIATDFGSSDGRIHVRCRVCRNRRAREHAVSNKRERKKGLTPTRVHKNPDWLSIGPMRAWVERVLKEMQQSYFCERAGIQDRRLHSIRFEQDYINYYIADSILTRLQGPPIWELYPDVDKER